MSECTVLDLNEKIKDGNINLIDVREYIEFANGRVAESRHIPIADIGKLHEEADTSEKIYLISQTGKRSAEALDILHVIGFKDLISVRGGLDAWEAAGFPIEKDEVAPWDIERQSRFASGALVFFGVVFGLFIHWSFVLISAIVGAGLMISAYNKTSLLGTILLKMPWNKFDSKTKDNS